jgi:hypothetical protein
VAFTPPDQINRSDFGPVAHIFMRVILALLFVLFCGIAIAQNENENDARLRQETVQLAFSEVSRGMYTSWSEKYLARLGDSAAPEIMKLLQQKKMTTKDAQTAVSLVNMSFATPRIIRNEANRQPRSTLSLLDYLDQNSADSTTKAKIRSTRERLLSVPTVPAAGQRSYGSAQLLVFRLRQ